MLCSPSVLPSHLSKLLHKSSDEIADAIEGKDFILLIKHGFAHLIANEATEGSSTADVWTDFRLVEYRDIVSEETRVSSDVEYTFVLLPAWAVCLHCKQGLRTHKRCGNGKLRNVGVTSLRKHLNSCCKKVSKTINVGKAASTPKISTYLYNKRKLPNNMLPDLSKAETRFVVSGIHSFSAVEDKGFKCLAQTLVDIGAKCGKVDVSEVLYGRQSVAKKVEIEYDVLQQNLHETLKTPIDDRAVSLSTDMWTDNYTRRSYLNVSVFWINKNWDIVHSSLRCKHFLGSHSADSISTELTSILSDFDIPIDYVPVTTDAGSNFVCALKNQLR